MRTSLRFLAEIEAYFLHLIGHPDALVTDATRLSDFFLFDSERAIGPGSRPGTFVFDSPRGPREIEARPLRRLFIERIRTELGVDLSTVADEPLPALLLYLRERMTPEAIARMRNRGG